MPRTSPCPGHVCLKIEEKNLKLRVQILLAERGAAFRPLFSSCSVDSIRIRSRDYIISFPWKSAKRARQSVFPIWVSLLRQTSKNRSWKIMLCGTSFRRAGETRDTNFFEDSWMSWGERTDRQESSKGRLSEDEKQGTCR